MSLRDRLLLLASAVLTAMGVFLLAKGNLKIGLSTTVMFGLAFAVFGHRAWSAAATARAFATDAKVSGLGGVRIRASRVRPAIAAVGCLAVGVTFSWAFADQGPWPAALGWLIAGFGLVVGVALIVRGPEAMPWIQLAAEGLQMGNPKARYTVPWDDIVGAQLGEVGRAPAVFIALRGLDGTLATVEPAERRASTAQAFSTSVAWVGFPIMVQPAAFGVEPAFFLRAIQQYVTDPGSRAELAAKVELPG